MGNFDVEGYVSGCLFWVGDWGEFRWILFKIFGYWFDFGILIGCVYFYSNFVLFIWFNDKD